MTDGIIDLTNFRRATGGDLELEQELFEEFIQSSQTLIQKLQSHCRGEADGEAWRSAAHAMKGICLNLGAQTLADFCRQGQDGFESDTPYKSDLLDKIKAERERVVEYLRSQGA
ncbi:MAG: Hpt domain-containing protein [Alphaproteobacteria bacterium]|nr:Hpt domain-containing protein [Alphaproteobacteria bacterium]MCD8570493.1 Hpt domain-containing protein [Alphaproteobacteria bacterium]